jgi:antitoxin PrlF
MTATVTQEGQVIIPKPIRDFLGLQAGSAVDFVRKDNGDVVLVAADKTESFFSQFRGHAGPGLTTDEVMAMTRGED